MRIPPDVLAVLNRLIDAGFEAVAVGGCVRDLLLGKTPDDWDAASAATPEQAHRVLNDLTVIDTGVLHGTVTVLTGVRAVELTTFRTESGTADHRHPAALTFSDSLMDDLQRRDFTVNAMALRPNGEVVDAFGGREDLRRRLIRAVGDPRRRMEEDALRLFRGVRFAATLGFAVEPATADAIRTMAPLLRTVAVERMQTELKKWIVTDGVLTTLRDFAPLFEQGLPPLDGLRADDPRLAVLPALPRDPALRLAALTAATPDPAASLPAWRLSKATTFAISGWLDHQNDPIPATRAAVRQCLALRPHPEWWQKLWAWQATKTPKAADAAAEAGRLLAAALADGDCVSLKDLAVDGRDLMAWGVPAGPAVGRMLSSLLDAVTAGECENTRAALQARVAALLHPA